MAGEWDGGEDEGWDEPCIVTRDVSPEAFMEELCTNAGGYPRFFRSLMWHYIGWWLAVVAVPGFFLDHHKCEAKQPLYAWFLYSCVIAAMLVMVVLMEISLVQRLGLFQGGSLTSMMYDSRWQVPLLGTVLWKLDAYTDVVFIFIARDCGSSLWWASLATFIFGVVFGQMLFNVCFACTDCDHELPSSFGFVLLDFKLVNAAVRGALTFDPDVSHLPVGRPVTLRTASNMVGIEKFIGDIAQVCIQILFLGSAKYTHGFVFFSVGVGILNGCFSLSNVIKNCVQEEWAAQARTVQQGTALKGLTETSSSSPGAGASRNTARPPVPERIGRTSAAGTGRLSAAVRGTTTMALSGGGTGAGGGLGGGNDDNSLVMDLL